MLHTCAYTPKRRREIARVLAGFQVSALNTWKEPSAGSLETTPTQMGRSVLCLEGRGTLPAVERIPSSLEEADSRLPTALRLNWTPRQAADLILGEISFNAFLCVPSLICSVFLFPSKHVFR